MNNDEIKQMLLENKASMERVETMVVKMRKKMLWGTIGSILRILLIVGPLVFGIIYLSPFLKQYSSGLQSALNVLRIVPDTNLDSYQSQSVIPKDTIEIICDPETRQSIINQICE